MWWIPESKWDWFHELCLLSHRAVISSLLAVWIQFHLEGLFLTCVMVVTLWFFMLLCYPFVYWWPCCLFKKHHAVTYSFLGLSYTRIMTLNHETLMTWILLCPTLIFVHIWRSDIFFNSFLSFEETLAAGLLWACTYRVSVFPFK